MYVYNSKDVVRKNILMPNHLLLTGDGEHSDTKGILQIEGLPESYLLALSRMAYLDLL
jgi:hypothetical protein